MTGEQLKIPDDEARNQGEQERGAIKRLERRIPRRGVPQQEKGKADYLGGDGPSISRHRGMPYVYDQTKKKDAERKLVHSNGKRHRKQAPFRDARAGGKILIVH